MSSQVHGRNAPTPPLVKPIPGDYGPWFIGPIRDRLDYFYNEGQDAFFANRRDKYKSTVYRANMPPGPFMAKDSRVIVLLDGASFPVLFDMDKVEKRDIFTGTFMPPTSLTGGYRVLPYLDPSEPKHAQLKQLLFLLLANRKAAVIPSFFSAFFPLFDTVEEQVTRTGKSDFAALNEVTALDYVTTSYFGVKPSDTKLGADGPKCCKLWLLFNLHPLFVLGLPKYLEDLLLHFFHLPPFLVKSYYNKLHSFVSGAGAAILDEAVKMGLDRDEASHSLVFATCFNSYGGFKVFFPSLLKLVGLAGEAVHAALADEVRAAVQAAGGQVTSAALEQMPLVKSAVYEALRLEPPVQFQYGKAKKDLVVSSHDASFLVKKGEVLFGYQPFATKDPKIFDDAEKYVADRFVGDDGEKLLKYVLWANGPETDKPTVQNKMCAGRDFVVVGGRLLVVALFLRYDTFTVDPVIQTLAKTVINITSFKKAGASNEKLG